MAAAGRGQQAGALPPLHGQGGREAGGAGRAGGQRHGPAGRGRPAHAPPQLPLRRPGRPPHRLHERGRAPTSCAGSTRSWRARAAGRARTCWATTPGGAAWRSASSASCAASTASGASPWTPRGARRRATSSPRRTGWCAATPGAQPGALPRLAAAGAGREDLPGHRRRGAGHGRQDRLRAGAGRPPGARPEQDVRARHRRRAGADPRGPAPARALPRHPAALPPRLDLQGGHLHRGAGGGDLPARHGGQLPRPLQHGVGALALRQRGRPRPGRLHPRAGRQLRRLLLPGRRRCWASTRSPSGRASSGLGAPTGFDVAGEVPGVMPDVAWHDARVARAATRRAWRSTSPSARAT